jgi:hypothetical protein
MAALRAKAILYDRLKAGGGGGVETQSIASLATLVDFSAKPSIESSDSVTAPLSHPTSDGVGHGKSTRSIATEEEANILQPAKVTSEYSYQWSRGETHRSGDSASAVSGEGEDGVGRDHLMDTATWKRHRAAERSFHSLVSSAVQSEVEQSSAATKQLREVSQAARVKSQWEKTLSGPSRDLLEQIHAQTEREKRAKEIGSSPIGVNTQGISVQRFDSVCPTIFLFNM